MSLLSIIIPCYNEQETVPLFYEAVTPVIQGMDCEYELIFVDDGSKDDTLAAMRRLAKMDERVTYIALSRNFGKEAAMYAGLRNASGDFTAVMDADLQDPPSLLPEMLETLRTGEYDCVAARRVSRQGEGRIKSAFARLFYKLINKLSDLDIEDGARDFRLMKREMVDAVVSMGEYNRFSKGIFAWVGFKTAWISYENVERVAGETKWSFFQLCRYAVDGMLNFSQTPLMLVSWFGVFMTLFSALALVFIVVRKLLFGDPVAGWPSMVCVIILIGGIELFCLGIAGQYIAKMYMEVKHRPHYIVAKSNKKNIR